MSALGQKQTCAARKPMSALPPKADIDWVDASGLAGLNRRGTWQNGPLGPGQMWGRVLFASLARAVLLFGVAAISAFSEKAHAAGAAYVVDTADVSEPGACKVKSGFVRKQPRFLRGHHADLCGRCVSSGGAKLGAHSHARRRGMDERHRPENQDQSGADRDRKLGHRDIRPSRRCRPIR